MKLIKLLLIMSTFLIMVAAILNLLNSTAETPDRSGIYIELIVMFILTISMVLLNSQEKKIKELEKQKKEEEL
ncbi:hypothetical protein [Labilibaculum antarcticum]|uniref:Uncharacterized protein n=1 Tax=Labilibaculum antarcticum TaxID=1717717 RepID=A0A1Y1CMT8_9BACT|nr:hypothetical protein [Labilibaculum antarcticum]BAX80581.1 hypothetical protein ALGA_2249 [Labilibaculum antarcticum]